MTNSKTIRPASSHRTGVMKSLTIRPILKMPRRKWPPTPCFASCIRPTTCSNNSSGNWSRRFSRRAVSPSGSTKPDSRRAPSRPDLLSAGPTGSRQARRPIRPIHLIGPISPIRPIGPILSLQIKAQPAQNRPPHPNDQTVRLARAALARCSRIIQTSPPNGFRTVLQAKTAPEISSLLFALDSSNNCSGANASNFSTALIGMRRASATASGWDLVISRRCA